MPAKLDTVWVVDLDGTLLKFDLPYLNLDLKRLVG